MSVFQQWCCIIYFFILLNDSQSCDCYYYNHESESYLLQIESIKEIKAKVREVILSLSGKGI